MTRNPRISIALALAVALAGFAAPARPGVAGRVIGQISDPAGEPLQGVQVTMQALDSDYKVEAESNKKGRVVLQILDASWDYRIELRKQGYGSIAEPIDPIPGDILRKEWVMRPEEAPRMEIERIDTRSRAATLYNDGIDLLQANRLEEAIPKFQGALAEAPDLALAHAALARLYLALGDFTSAVGEAKSFREMAPEDPQGIKILYDAYWGVGDQESSAALLDEMIAADPGSGTAARVYNIGVEAVKRGDLEEARRRFLQALEVYPELSQAYLPLGQIEAALGQNEAALEWARRHLEGSPGDSRALLVAYRAHTGLGNAAEAEQVFEQLKESDPASTADLFFKDGSNLFNAGQTKLATASFQRVLLLVPDHPRGHYMLALCYASGGDTAKAKEHLSRFLELAPDDPEAEMARQMLASL